MSLFVLSFECLAHEHSFLLPMPIAWTPFRKRFFFFRREVGQLQGRLGHQPEK